MTNDQITSAFMLGSKDVIGNKRMSIRNYILYSYDTPIATITGNTLNMNWEKYSKTTTVLQNELSYRARILGINTLLMTEEEFNTTFNTEKDNVQ